MVQQLQVLDYVTGTCQLPHILYAENELNSDFCHSESQKQFL